MKWVCIGLVLATACGQATKTDAKDDFSELAALKSQGKADGIDNMVVGALSYGQQSNYVYYSSPPDYRIIKFTADTGDKVDIRVTSSNGGDPVTWLLNDDFQIIAYNDDATTSSVSSRILTTIPAHPSHSNYIVFRDYYYDSRKFKVYLDGVKDFKSCQRDSDCVMTEVGCCPVGAWTAVSKLNLAAFQASKNCPANPSCPVKSIKYHGESAICDSNKTCKVVLPEQIACGGHTVNPHFCPDGWQCMGAQLPVDGTGDCIKICGGYSGQSCPIGLNCVDDPFDNCNPAFGAGCDGICVEGYSPDCDQLGC